MCINEYGIKFRFISTSMYYTRYVYEYVAVHEQEGRKDKVTV